MKCKNTRSSGKTPGAAPLHSVFGIGTIFETIICGEMLGTPT